MTPSIDAKDELVDFDFYWMMSCFECETTEVFLLRSGGFDGDNESDRFYIGHQRANVTIDVLLNGNDHYIVDGAFQEIAFTWLPEDGQTGAEEVQLDGDFNLQSDYWSEYSKPLLSRSFFDKETYELSITLESTVRGSRGFGFIAYNREADE